jgi:YggT family protein
MDAMTIVRYAVFGLVALAAVAALAAMAVQRRALNPFGRPARTIRDLTDPLVKPIERVLLRRGGNPQNAPWWLLGIAIVTGIVVVSAVNWAYGTFLSARFAAHSGPRATIAFVLNLAIWMLMLALMIRVIGSWLGAGRFTPWMRPFWVATEWLLAPLRRVIPPVGPFDLSPLVAWFILSLLRPVLIGLVV